MGPPGDRAGNARRGGAEGHPMGFLPAGLTSIKPKKLRRAIGFFVDFCLISGRFLPLFWAFSLVRCSVGNSLLLELVVINALK